MYCDEYDNEISYAKRAADEEAIAAFKARAEEIAESTYDKRLALAKELLEYAHEHLDDYQYDSRIEMLVAEVVEIGQLDSYEFTKRDGFHFWLPSNFGC